MAYFAALTPILILAMSIGLGFSKENWFIEFGLAIVVISAGTSIYLAYRGAKSAAAAKKVAFEEFLPKLDERKSSSFSMTGDIMGEDVNNPIGHLKIQIKDIKNEVINNAKNFNDALRFNAARIDICLAQIRYHEQVTLPKILGQGSGAIVLAGILTIIGSVYLAVPVGVYQAFSNVAGALQAMLPTL
ncbi:hypothetical protein [Pseudomonas koreensis]|uniref:Uncharacterized protein n=1 Tax=Pseudomonas koreensis TaxID=198620 RepID=A0AA94ENJ5_9PSED|nr:hypothetical protein [Pseudomonas koreensis]RVD76873.1 hypothetical protein A9HBioS_3413 [Pseudomonas koreensis]